MEGIWPIIERLGLPTVLLIVGVVWIARWVLAPLMKAHLELLESVKETNQTSARHLKKQTVILRKLLSYFDPPVPPGNGNGGAIGFRARLHQPPLSAKDDVGDKPKQGA